MDKVTQLLNDFIDQQKTIFSDSDHETMCMNKTEEDCTGRWAHLEQNA